MCSIAGVLASSEKFDSSRSDNLFNGLSDSDAKCPNVQNGPSCPSGPRNRPGAVVSLVTLDDSRARRMIGSIMYDTLSNM